MSRVRSALKRADDWNGKSVFTGEADMRPPAISTFGPAKRIALPEMPAFPSHLSAAGEHGTLAYSTRRPRILVWLRRLRRRFFSTPTPVPRCTGTTRLGLPCRAPAMDNGLCRMHGGARRPTLRERLSFTS